MRGGSGVGLHSLQCWLKIWNFWQVFSITETETPWIHMNSGNDALLYSFSHNFWKRYGWGRVLIRITTFWSNFLVWWLVWKFSINLISRLGDVNVYKFKASYGPPIWIDLSIIVSIVRVYKERKILSLVSFTGAKYYGRIPISFTWRVPLECLLSNFDL